MLRVAIRYDDDQGVEQTVRYRFDAEDALNIAKRHGYREMVQDPVLLQARIDKLAEADALDPTTPEWEVKISELKVIESQLRTLVPNPASVEEAAFNVIEDFLADGLVDNSAVNDAVENARRTEQESRKNAAKTKIRQP